MMRHRPYPNRVDWLLLSLWWVGCLMVGWSFGRFIMYVAGC